MSCNLRKKLPSHYGVPPQGRVCEAVNAVPAPAEDTASVELASAAEGTATAKHEGLEPCAGGKAGHARGRERGLECREKGLERRAREGRMGATWCRETTWQWQGTSAQSESRRCREMTPPTTSTRTPASDRPPRKIGLVSRDPNELLESEFDVDMSSCLYPFD